MNSGLVATDLYRDFENQIISATRLEEVWDLFLQAMLRFGVKNVLFMYSPYSTVKKPYLYEKVIIKHNYDEKFSTFYVNSRLDHDWSVRHCLESTVPQKWGAPEMLASLTEPEERNEILCRDRFGIWEGFLIPLWGKEWGGRAGVGLSATGMSAREWDKIFCEHQLTLERMAWLAHNRIMSSFFADVVGLTKSEMDVLFQLSQGTGYKELSSALHLSKLTVSKRLAAISGKIRSGILPEQIISAALHLKLVN